MGARSGHVGSASALGRRIFAILLLGTTLCVVGLNLGRGAPAARANDGDPLILGSPSNSASSETHLTSAASVALDATASDTGVRGAGAVYGLVGAGTDPTNVFSEGVRGQAYGGGVFIADGPSGIGVEGFTIDPNGDATGVYGHTGASSGYGVKAVNDNPTFGEGLFASGTIGIHTEGKLALEADGAVQVHGNSTFGGTTSFSDAGMATIGVGKSRVTVSVPDLGTGALVLAVAQTQVSGIWVAAAVPNAATHKATIYLNQATGAKLTVAWFVIY